MQDLFDHSFEIGHVKEPSIDLDNKKINMLNISNYTEQEMLKEKHQKEFTLEKAKYRLKTLMDLKK